MARGGAYAKLYELQLEDGTAGDRDVVIKSMTGFASLTHEDERATIGVTVRAVNHRFLDLQLRLPQSFGDLEPRVRALLQKRLARGRVELAITVQLRNSGDADRRAERRLRQRAARGDRAGARARAGVGHADAGRPAAAAAGHHRSRAAGEADPAVEAQLAASVEAAVEQALADLDAMRVREGDHLRADLDGRRQMLAG